MENTTSAWTTRFDSGAEILIPLKNAEGRYVADPRTLLDELEGEGRVLFRYVGAATRTASRATTSPVSVRPTAASPA